MPTGVYQHSPMSQATKDKIAARRRLNPTRYFLGKKRPEISALFRKTNKGRKITWANKISEALKGRYIGNLSPSWKHGLSRTKEYKAHYDRIKREKRRNAKGSYSREEWENLKKKYGYMCLCCKRFEPEIKLTVDHIVPIRKGGMNVTDNLQPLCRSCNSKKHLKIIKYEAI